MDLRDGQRDFDFLFGTWRVRHRRLRNPLSGTSEWYEFDGTSIERPLWGGNANVEEMDLNSPLGRFQAVALRLYDVQTRLWSIYWATDTNGLTTIPTVGSFDGNGVGTFYDDEIYDGKPIVCRFVWTHDGPTPQSCRWEQAFSPDGRKTWETNWTMTFERVQ